MTEPGDRALFRIVWLIVFVISSVLSCRSKNLKQRTDKCYYSSVLLLGYSSVLFGKQRKVHPRGMRVGQPKRSTEKRERVSILAPRFICFSFLLPLSLPYVNWASQEGCLFHLRFSLWSSDFLFFHLHRLFPFFVLPPPFWTPFSYSNYLT